MIQGRVDMNYLRRGQGGGDWDGETGETEMGRGATGRGRWRAGKGQEGERRGRQGGWIRRSGVGRGAMGRRLGGGDGEGAT